MSAEWLLESGINEGTLFPLLQQVHVDAISIFSTTDMMVSIDIGYVYALTEETEGLLMHCPQT